MAETSPDIETLLREAVALDASLRELIDGMLTALSGAGRMKQALAKTLIRRGLGVPMGELRDRIDGHSESLRSVAAGETSLESARPELRAYAELIDRLARWVEGLEHVVAGRVSDAAQREAVLREGHRRIGEARRLSEILGEI